MKKTMLICAGALLIGATAVNAQDTTRTRSQSTQQTPRQSGQSSQSSQSSSQSSQSSDQMNRDKSSSGDRTLVRSTDIPASLRQSLQSSDYTGWESGQVYRTKNGEYILEMNKNGTTKTHRFDANGKPIKE
jgi:hypothetical protein